MLIFDHYLLFNIVPKFVLHQKISQSLLRNYKFKIQKLFKIAAPTTVLWNNNDKQCKFPMFYSSKAQLDIIADSLQIF